MKLLISILVIFTLLNLKIYSQENVTLQLSLKQAQEFALENNPQILNAKLDVLIAKKKVWETTAIGLPQVNSTATYSNIFEVPEMNFGGYIDWTAMDPTIPLTSGMVLGNYVEGEPIQLGTKENITWDVTVSQLIFSGEYIVGLQASKVFKLLSAQNLQKTENDVIEAINQTYYLVLMAEENKKILEKSLNNTKQIWDEMQKTLNVGFVEETTVDQLELTYKNLDNTLKNINRQVDLSYEMLRLQLGIENDTNITLTDNLESIFKEVNVDNIVALPFALEENVDYKLLETQEKLSLLTLRQMKSKALPTISAFYKHQEQLNTPDFNFFNPNMIGVSLSLPIFSSGMRCAKTQQAKLELEKTSNLKNFVSQQLEIEVLQAKADLNTNYEKYLNEKDNLELAEKIYNQYLKKFKEGMASSMELTQSQNQYLSTQANYISSMITVLNSKNKLDKALNNYK